MYTCVNIGVYVVQRSPHSCSSLWIVELGLGPMSMFAVGADSKSYLDLRLNSMNPPPTLQLFLYFYMNPVEDGNRCLTFKAAAAIRIHCGCVCQRTCTDWK